MSKLVLQYHSAEHSLADMQKQKNIFESFIESFFVVRVAGGNGLGCCAVSRESERSG